VERALDVRTAEAIAVRYELAGLGSRFLALTVDMAIQFGVVLAVLVALAVFSVPVARAVAWVHLDKTAYVVALTLLAVATFALFFGYFINFELAWNGQTPGKRALGIRVVRDEGFPVDFGAAVIRNVVRLVELTLGMYVVSALVMLLSPENKRPGDFAAGTIVVRDRNETVGDLDAYLDRPVRPDTGLSEPDRLLIDRFLARRATLDRSARERLATRIAARVRPTLRARYDHLDDETLLEYLTGQ